MIIANLLFSIILTISFLNESLKFVTSYGDLKDGELKNNYIQVIPSKGILLDSDSILIGKTGVADLLRKIDSNSIYCKLTLDLPRQLEMTTINSPPPGYTGEIMNQPEEYFTEYLANLKCDSLTFYFSYHSKGRYILNEYIYLDSLRISSILLTKPLNAGLSDNLKMGSPYEEIFKYFEKPKYFSQPDIIKREYKYSGIIFTIETDKSRVNDYGKIVGIEINNLLVM